MKPTVNGPAARAAPSGKAEKTAPADMPARTARRDNR